MIDPNTMNAWEVITFERAIGRTLTSVFSAIDEDNPDIPADAVAALIWTEARRSGEQRPFEEWAQAQNYIEMTNDAADELPDPTQPPPKAASSDDSTTTSRGSARTTASRRKPSAK
jgi:hypothetical protein